MKISDRAQDGCYGGHYADVFKFLAKFGHLASESTAPYSSTVGDCLYDDVENGLKDAHLNGTEYLNDDLSFMCIHNFTDY